MAGYDALSPLPPTKPGVLTEIQFTPHGNRHEQDSNAVENDMQSLHQHILRTIAMARGYWQEIEDSQRKEVHFLYDSQWGDIEEDENPTEKTPRLEMNLLPKYVQSITGYIRTSKISVKVSSKRTISMMIPVRGKEKGISYPEAMEGVIRDIEQRNNAHMKYARAAQHAVEGGLGWLHYHPEKDPTDPFSYEIKITHIKDRYSVMMDPGWEEPDMSDAQWGLRTRRMYRKDFRSAYPEAAEVHGDSSGNLLGVLNGMDFNNPGTDWWYDGKVVNVIDYYWREPMKRTAIKLENEKTGEEMVLMEDMVSEEILDDLNRMGYTEKVERMEFDSFKVKLVRLTASEIIEGPVDVMASRIPIIPVCGRMVDKGNRQEFHSLIRYAKDPQRLCNISATLAAERMADSPKATWIATTGQIAGYEEQWEESGIQGRSLLVYNMTTDGEKQLEPKRLPPTQISTVELTVFDMSMKLLENCIGIYDAQLGIASNETSGRAIQNRRDASMQSVQEYFDNCAFSVASGGNLLCEMVQNIYTGRQVQRILYPDGTGGEISLGGRMKDPDTGQEFPTANMNFAKFECAATITNAADTLNQQMLEEIRELGKTSPELYSLMGDKLVLASDIPGKEAIARRMRSIMPPHALSEEEKKDIQPPPPSPEEMKLQGEIEKINIQNNANIEVAKITLEIEKTRLEREETVLKRAEVEVTGAVAITEGKIADAAMPDSEKKQPEKKSK